MDQAPSLRCKLKVHDEDSNRLNRDIILEEFTLATRVSSGRILVEDSTLKLLRGNKYGLVGRNGVGKTTLLRALAGHRIEGIYSHMRIAYVDDGSDVSMVAKEGKGGEADADAAAEDGATALEYLLAQHSERKAALEEMKRVMEHDGDVDLEWLDDVCERLRHLSADRALADANRVLTGLGIDPSAKLATLSGGWRHRVALATSLFVECDLLLLDEPTRSLDLIATTWLEGFLRETNTTVVVVSHDVEFLNAFTTHIVQLEDRRLRTFAGNHDTFLDAITAIEAHKRRAYIAQEGRRRRWEATITRLQERAEKYGSESAARQMRSRRIAMEKRLGQALDGTYWKYGLMGPRPLIDAPKEEEPVDFELLTDLSDVPEAANDENGTALFRLRDASFRYARDAPDVLTSVNLDITVNTRIALVGPNGSGKTTLLRMLAGEVAPTGGSALRWDGLRVAYMPQDAAKALSSELRPVHWLQSHFRELSTDEAIDSLRGFGLATPEVLNTPVQLLSDGQRTRMLLAKIQCDQPHVVLLDEPTGHLDPQSAAALTSALDFFAGAVIVASHDRTFIRSLDPELYVCNRGELAFVEGDVDAYCRQVRKAHAAAARKSAPRSRPAASGAAAQPAAAAAAQGGPAGAAVAVHCRKCGGDHFTFSCPAPPPGPKRNDKKQKAADARQAAPTVKVPLREKASDGKGDWKVVVSKQTLRNLARKQS